MTDDELRARLHDELRAVQAYFAYREGREGDQPLSDVVAALMRHCRVGVQ